MIMSETVSEITAARKQLLERIQASSRASGREPGETCLVAISKRQPEERVQAALDVGQRVFGENLMAEAETRWQERRRQYPHLRLHLVGHLQSNKAERAVALFDVIETLDSLKLARAIEKASVKTGRIPELYVQVNTGAEAQKSGVLPKDLPEFLAAIHSQTNLQPVGLMCIPPRNEEPGLHFALLAKLARRHGLTGLSMGMSGDFETAIAFGATHVRVGTALFGERAY